MPKQIPLFDINTGFQVASKHTTHSGGKGEYLHDWYSYLEGYSSEFVLSVYDYYMPQAKLVMDPFAGIGTTPLVMAFRGVKAAYCELNPAMRRVINAKFSVAVLPKAQKLELYYSLMKLIDDLPGLISNASEDEKLKSTYKSAFNKSKFFNEETYSDVLKLRAINDELLRTAPLIGSALQIAIISKLVECSYLKRAGDVRYKTKKELEKGVPRIVESIGKQLWLMAMDCRNCPKAIKSAKLIAKNAKSLSSIEPIKADGLITSPPYLNGTNYFRNTKLELWYMRDITSEKSLRQFRNEVVTSGINDVTKEKGRNIHPAVRELVSKLYDDAYDQRIPRMVAGYFADMHTILSGVASHLIMGAKACIDIGDSLYGGVHVPTHELLSEIANECGFKTQGIVALRKRRSRDKTPLTQSMIILERELLVNKNKYIHPQNPNSNNDHQLNHNWEAFKDSLPHMKYPFSKRNWGNELHSVCSYQGKLKPSLAYHLIEAFTSPGDTVLDPFSGSGTIPLEAALNGRKAFGLDLGRLATALSNAKLKRADPNKVENIINRLESYIKKNRPSKKALLDSQQVKFNKSIPEYFHNDTLREILCARDYLCRYLKPENPEWAPVISCMLHILHGNRPYALSRRSHPITPYAPTGEYIYKNLINHLRVKVNKTLTTKRPESFLEGHCFNADILKEWPKEIKGVNAIITSPPFFDSTKFYMTNWMRYWFLGWGREDFEKQTKQYIEVLQKRSFDWYDSIFKKCFDRLKSGGRAIFHLGFSKKCDMGNTLIPYAKKYFTVEDLFIESVEHCESHGISDKGSVKGHQYLILKK
jgi:DNA modification methylase